MEELLALAGGVAASIIGLIGMSIWSYANFGIIGLVIYCILVVSWIVSLFYKKDVPFWYATMPLWNAVVFFCLV